MRRHAWSNISDGRDGDTGEHWSERASCRDHDPEMWFPNGKGAQATAQYDLARRVCSGCPVLANCRKWTRKHLPEYGMFAAMTPEDRRRRWGAPITAYHHPRRAVAS